MIEEAILSPLCIEEILGTGGRFVRHTAPFIFQSRVLYEAGFPAVNEAPTGFVQDLESIWRFRGSSPAGGTGHDLASRKDFLGGKVSKRLAAALYKELMRCEYEINGLEFNETLLMNIKSEFVIWWPGYFHKHNVMATFEEMTRNKRWL